MNKQQKMHYTDISPPAKSRYQSRPSLLKLVNHSTAKLTLIEAPPGYRKTALLSQIYHHNTTPSVWLNLRPSDKEINTFLYKLQSAFALLPESKSVTLDVHKGFATPNPDHYVSQISTLINSYKTFSFYINDAQYAIDSKSLYLINKIIQETHSGIRFYSTSTQPSTLTFAGFLMDGELLNIDQNSLKFNDEDLATLLNQNPAAPKISRLLQNQLIEMTEGWPAAIYYAVTHIKDIEHFNRFLQELPQGARSLDRYFTETIYSKESETTQKLMLKLALLDRFNTELCQQLCPAPSILSPFNKLIRNSTFITPIDSTQTWFRFHQLFDVFLKKQGTFELTTQDVSSTLETAEHWFYLNGDHEEAIHLALRAKQYSLAAQWMGEAFATVVIRYAKTSLYISWAKQIPEKVLSKNPRTRIGLIWSLTQSRQYLAATEQIHYLLREKSHFSVAIQEEISRTTELMYCTTQALRDQYENIEKPIQQWLEKWQNIDDFHSSYEYHYQRGIAWLIRGFIAKCQSHFELSRGSFRHSLAHFEAYGSHYGIAWAQSIQAVALAKQGAHHEAFELTVKAYHTVHEALGDNFPPSYCLAVMIAAISYEFDELENAKQYLTHTLAILKNESSADMLIAAYQTSCRLMMADEQFDAGYKMLDEGILWAQEHEMMRLKYSLISEKLVWFCRHRSLLAATQLVNKFALDSDKNTTKAIDKGKKICSQGLARLNIAQNQFIKAKYFLDLYCHPDTLGEATRQTAEWLKTQAILHLQEQDLIKADSCLKQALGIASVEHYYRMFIDDRSELSERLRHINNTSKNESYSAFLKQLVQKLHTDVVSKNGKLDALTGKETSIIQKLQLGHPNKQIANELFISEGTLKWHLHNIYTKLQVKNRTQALVKARAQGYLKT